VEVAAELSGSGANYQHRTKIYNHSLVDASILRVLAETEVEK